MTTRSDRATGEPASEPTFEACVTRSEHPHVVAARGLLDGAAFDAAVPGRAILIAVGGRAARGYARADEPLLLLGAHCAPLDEVIGLDPPADTFRMSRPATSDRRGGFALVSEEVGALVRGLAGRSGAAFEAVLSPLVVVSAPEHEELRELAQRALHGDLYHHYREECRRLESRLGEADPAPASVVLDLFSSALTGLHMLRTGRVSSDFEPLLAEHFGFPLALELARQRTASATEPVLDPARRAAMRADARRLLAELDAAAEDTLLPPSPPNRGALDDFLVRVRRASGALDGGPPAVPVDRAAPSFSPLRRSGGSADRRPG